LGFIFILSGNVINIRSIFGREFVQHFNLQYHELIAYRDVNYTAFGASGLAK
jgi:hypothetical protein